MSVNSYLCGIASSLVLSDSEKASITKSLDTITKRISSYFLDVYEKKVFGSHVRGTILPRKADNNSDIDLMVVFANPNGYKPQSFLNRLKTFVEHYYTRSEIYQSSPTIVLELNHIKFELVPAYVNYGYYHIPKNSTEWQYTDPDAFHNKLQNCNKANNYKIKPVIRLLKHWNIQKNDRDLASFALEQKIANDLRFSHFSCTSYTDYLKTALETIRYNTQYTHVNTAIDCIKTSLRLEAEGYHVSALSKIKEAFPLV